MVELDVWSDARARVGRVLRFSHVWCWLTAPLALAAVIASLTWLPPAWQVLGSVTPVVLSELARRTLRDRRLATAAHTVRDSVGHDVLLMPAREVAALLLDGCVVHDGMQVTAVTHAESVHFETEAVRPPAGPPLTTIFMRGGGAGDAGTAF
jgi:hypothetical protein